MDINDLTIGQAREIAAYFSASSKNGPGINNGMIGKYVIVRCRDAGVHAGILEQYSGREALLRDARRLWYWKAANGAAFLSGVAVEGIDGASKIGAPIRVHLTETCEIIECTDAAKTSIMGAKTHAGK